MPPRKKKKTRRRDNAISLTNMAEALMLADVGTKAAFNMGVWNWASDGWTSGSSGRAYGPGQISLHELIYGNYASSGVPTIAGGGYGQTIGGTSLQTTSNSDVVMNNLQNNWGPALVKSILIPVGFRVSRRALSRPIRMGNKLLKQAGLRSVVII